MNYFCLDAPIFSTASYGSESWAFTRKLEAKLDAFEMWCYRRMMQVTWMEKRTNRWVLHVDRERAGTEEEHHTTEDEILWTCMQKQQTGKNSYTGDDGRQERTRLTKGGVERWYKALDRNEERTANPPNGEPNGMEEECVHHSSTLLCHLIKERERTVDGYSSRVRDATGPVDEYSRIPTSTQVTCIAAA